MKKVTVELDWDTVDNIVKQELVSCLENLKTDLKNRKSKNSGLAVFSTDKKVDVALLKDHIDAVNMVLSYYGVNDV